MGVPKLQDSALFENCSQEFSVCRCEGCLGITGPSELDLSGGNGGSMRLALATCLIYKCALLSVHSRLGFALLR